MMYHVSSTLGDGQLISPETKYNLLFKKAASNAQKTNETKSADKMPISAGKMPISADKMPISADEILEENLSKQQRQVLQYVKENGKITSHQAELLLQVKQRRARAILGEMAAAGLLEKQGAYKSTAYVRKVERSYGTENRVFM